MAMECSVSFPVSISGLSHCTIVLQGTTMEADRVEGTWDFYTVADNCVGR